MRAVVYERYGPPDVLHLKDVPKPSPKHNEVLVKIHATTVTATECSFRKGKPLFIRLFTGLTRPRITTLGEELAGEIEAVGKEVKSFKVGDQVFGSAGPTFGANGEYICLPENGVLARQPANLSYEEAASTVDGILTALPFLRDTGNIQSGQKVLIYGASGSIGTAAVQVAKLYGADVTGVCSTANLPLLKSLGADKVIDYTKEEFGESREVYDIIFDAVGKTSFKRCKRALKPDGVFLEAGITPAVLPQVLWTAMVGGKKAKIAATGLRPAAERAKDLVFLGELLEAGKIRPVIDRSYPLEQIADAHRYVDKARKKGNVVITIAHNAQN